MSSSSPSSLATDVANGVDNGGGGGAVGGGVLIWCVLVLPLVGDVTFMMGTCLDTNDERRELVIFAAVAAAWHIGPVEP